MMNRRIWITASLLPFVGLLCWSFKVVGKITLPSETTALQIFMGLTVVILALCCLFFICVIVGVLAYCLWVIAGSIERAIPSVAKYFRGLRVFLKDWWTGNKEKKCQN